MCHQSVEGRLKIHDGRDIPRTKMSISSPQTARNCPICGIRLPPYSGGRPRTYCSIPCRRMAERQVLRNRGSAEVAQTQRTLGRRR